MNDPLLLTPLAGVVVLVLAAFTGLRYRGGSRPNGTSYVTAVLVAIGAYLVLDSVALWFGPAAARLLDWLVVLLVVALACIVARMVRRPPDPIEPDPLVESAIAEPVAAGILDRADFHQVDLDLVVGEISGFDAIRRGFGIDAARAAEAALAGATRAAAPPDALVWWTGAGTVVVLGRVDAAETAEMAATVDAALVDSEGTHSTGARPVVVWSRVTTAEAGYVLADLEAAARPSRRLD